ncbi:hypothetical protein MCETHM1_00913 [Flavobacteriaceae bacterium]|jgi:hypothetical protein
MIFKRHKKTTSIIAVICGFLLFFRVSVFRFISNRVEFIRYLQEKSGDFYEVYPFQGQFKKGAKSIDSAQRG